MRLEFTGSLYTRRTKPLSEKELTSFDPSEWEPKKRTLNRGSKVGSAITDAAEKHGVDPSDLVDAVDYLWKEKRDAILAFEQAKQQAREATGLTRGRINAWEDAGKDYASWPSLDEAATEIAHGLPELGLAGLPRGTDLVARIWGILREGKQEPPAKHDPELIDEAAGYVLSSRVDDDVLAEFDPLQFAVAHAPKEGIWIGGEFFGGGQFIPERALNRATQQEKDALDQEPPESRADLEVQKGLPVRPEFSDATPTAFLKARGSSTRTSYLSELTKEDLHRVIADGGTVRLSEDGKVGYVLTADGDLQNVFNNGGPRRAGMWAVTEAIERGATTLDCFAGRLPILYNRLGFKAYRAEQWNEQYAPANWDYDQHGRPDIIYMRFEGTSRHARDIIRQIDRHGEFVHPAELVGYGRPVPLRDQGGLGRGRGESLRGGVGQGESRSAGRAVGNGRELLGVQFSVADDSQAERSAVLAAANAASQSLHDHLGRRLDQLLKKKFPSKS